MNYAFLALIVAVIGALPLFIARKIEDAIIMAVIFFLILWWLFYATAISIAYPLWGAVGIMTTVVLVINTFISIPIDNPRHRLIVSLFPVSIALIILNGSFAMGWSAFRWTSYADMAGNVVQRDWTKEIQPEAPEHMLMVSKANAFYLAQKAVGTAGAIGSQFNLSKKSITLQKINGRLVYAVPFDFSGFFPWYSTKGTPGFVLIDGQNPEAPVKVIQTKRKMRYMPNAWFGSNLERHLRDNGYMNVVLGDSLFEINEQGKPRWVIPLEKPTIAWSGLKVVGVAIVNPFTGEIKKFNLKDVPVWVDRVIPGKLVKQYLVWRGKYSGGWWNSWISKAGLTKPEKPLLIYGSNKRAEWVMGITSASIKDDSLIKLVFVDSRTGKAVEYNVSGGGTESAIKRAVNTNSKVQYKHLRASSPQIYNVYGKMAAVVPLLNDSNAFQGVAIVPLKDVQNVAVGATPNEALWNFRAILFHRGQKVVLANAKDMQTVHGIIARIHQDVGSNGSPYYLLIVGVPKIFTVSSRDYPKLPITQPGDKVTIKYLASDKKVVLVQSFDNTSISLNATLTRK